MKLLLGFEDAMDTTAVVRAAIPGPAFEWRRRICRRRMALPSDHGAWIFLLSPLIIGIAVGGQFRTVSIYLIVAVVAGLLVRHPVTVLVKIWSGRRSDDELPAALFWILIYGGIGLLMAVGLAVRGFGYLLYAALPGSVIFCWYLILVSRRAERGRTVLEILGAGVLALSAAAGLWVGHGEYLPLGWLLWVMTWAQSAASILFVRMRLDHRRSTRARGSHGQSKGQSHAVFASSLNALLILALGAVTEFSLWLFIAYLPQWLESLWFSRHPSDDPPVAVGVRQLFVSALYTVLFVLLW